MRRKEEDVLKEFRSALENLSDDELGDIVGAIDQRMQERPGPDVMDYLDMAEEASSKKKALGYVNKALELEPGNLDALIMQADISADTPEDIENAYLGLIKKEEKRLKAEGYFDEGDVGSFWLMLETRPYMRLLQRTAQLYRDCGKMRMAAAVCVKMLELCTGDNLGMRYVLMHIYAFLEDEAAAEALYKKYPNEGTQFLLPMAILYYKLGNVKKAEKYFAGLCAANKDTYKFFHAAVKGMQLEELSEMGIGYRPGTIEELIVDFQDNGFLYISVPGFFPWAEQRCKPVKGARKAKGAEGKAASSKTASSKAVSGKAVSGKAVSGNTSSGDTASGKGDDGETASEKNASGSSAGRKRGRPKKVSQ